MTGLLAVGAAVVGAWAILLGAAFLAHRLRFGRTASIGVVLACYVCLAAATVWALGVGWQGYAGAAGMFLPCAGAFVLVLIRPPRRPSGKQAG